MLTLAISYLTTFNLPWFMDLTFQIPMQQCYLQHWTLLLSTVPSTTGFCFCFGSIPSFFSRVISSLISSSILGTYQPGEFIFQCPLFLPFHTAHGVLTARILKWFAILQWTTFCQTSPLWPNRLLWPHRAWLSFIEFNKSVVHVIRLTSCLRLWFQSVCPLMPSLSVYRLTWVSLTWDAGYFFMATPAKRSRCSWPWTWDISSWPPLLRCHSSTPVLSQPI